MLGVCVFAGNAIPVSIMQAGPRRPLLEIYLLTSDLPCGSGSGVGGGKAGSAGSAAASTLGMTGILAVLPMTRRTRRELFQCVLPRSQAIRTTCKARFCGELVRSDIDLLLQLQSRFFSLVRKTV